MLGDCHVHMVLDGVCWRDAIARHRPVADERWVRGVLARYQAAGIRFLRDGGDASGVCGLAAEIAPEYGIDYRTPCFPIHRRGGYGGFIGRGYETLAEYRALVAEVRRRGGDFIKLMLSGLMDFDRCGVVTGTPLAADEIRELVAIAHGEGFAVMAHVNGAGTVRAALEAGVDSVEHGAYCDEACLRLLAASGAVWVPTLATAGNLRGTGRYDEAAVAKILAGQQARVARAAALGARIALGSDAGAWAVPHGQGTLDELALLQAALGAEAGAILANGEAAIRERFRRT